MYHKDILCKKNITNIFDEYKNDIENSLDNKYNISTIKPTKHSFKDYLTYKQGYNVEYLMPIESINSSDIYLTVYYDDNDVYRYDILDNIGHIDLLTKSDRYDKDTSLLVINVSIYTNLLFLDIIKKKVIFYDNRVEIPLAIFMLKQFIRLTSKYQISIRFYTKHMYKTAICYKYDTSFNNNIKYSLFSENVIRKSYYYKINIIDKNNTICIQNYNNFKFCIFCFECKNIVIDKIILHSKDNKYVYEAVLGDIYRYATKHSVYYAIYNDIDYTKLQNTPNIKITVEFVYQIFDNNKIRNSNVSSLML